jgi:hypothetical protein
MRLRVARLVVQHGLDFGVVLGYRLVDDAWQYETQVKFGCADIGCYCSKPEWIPTIELGYVKT